jgi:hypothetical protein
MEEASMISLSVGGFFVVYIGAWLAVLGFLWARELWRERLSDWALSEGSVCVCDNCHFAFLIKPGESAARCLRCGEMCSIRKRF